MGISLFPDRIDHFTVVFSDLALDCKRGWS